jgi:hypothetical protein
VFSRSFATAKERLCDAPASLKDERKDGMFEQALGAYQSLFSKKKSPLTLESWGFFLSFLNKKPRFEHSERQQLGA